MRLRTQYLITASVCPDVRSVHMYPDPAGRSAPPGATPSDGGVNFSVYSRNATGVDLLLFDHVDDGKPSGRPDRPGGEPDVPLLAPLRYGDRARTDLRLQGARTDGPLERPPVRCDEVLSPPVRPGRGGSGGLRPRRGLRRGGDNAATAMKRVRRGPSAYDWRGTARSGDPSSQTIVYEMHVRGFTRHPAPALPSRAGHLRRLRREDPVPEGARRDRGRASPGLRVRRPARPGGPRHWGYQPVSPLAPHLAYSSRPDPHGVVDELPGHGQGAPQGRAGGHT